MCCCFTQFSPQLSQCQCFVLDDEFDEEDGAGIVCVTLFEGQLDGITATVALSTSDDTATRYR